MLRFAGSKETAMFEGQRLRAFTLTELLVVVCVILILMSILVVGAGGVYTYAMRLKCQHNMEQIWHACQAYANDYAGLLPAQWNFTAERPWYQMLADEKYLDDTAVLACPSSDLSVTIGSGQAATELPIDTTTVEDSIKDALRYLKAHQDQSTGQWSHTSDTITGQLYHSGPFGLNGLAILALLGNGVTVDDAEFGDTLKEGLRNLMNQVYTTNDGTFGQGRCTGGGSKYFTYHQSACLLALCDAERTMPGLELAMPGTGAVIKLRDMAQVAFTHLIDTELNQYGGFVYHRNCGHNSCGDYSGLYSGDTSTTGWCWQAIELAKEIGLDPSQAFDDNGQAYTWESIQTAVDNYLVRAVPTNGTPGSGSYYPMTPYWWYYNGLEGSSRWTYFQGRDHISPTLPPGRWLFTACSLGERLIWGHELDASAPYGTIERDGYEQLQWLIGNDLYLKHARGESGYYHQDLYMIYYVSMAMNKLRGPAWEEWLKVWPDVAMNQLQENTGDYAPNYGKGSFPWWCVAYPYSNGIFQTAMGAMSLEMCIADTLPGTRWGGVSTPGQYPYGYNTLIANEDYRLRKPADDTVVLMDYLRDGIITTDPPENIAPRHGGKANVLFADGRVKAMTVDELIDPDTDTIKEGMLTLEPGD